MAAGADRYCKMLHTRKMMQYAGRRVLEDARAIFFEGLKSLLGGGPS